MGSGADGSVMTTLPTSLRPPVGAGAVEPVRSGAISLTPAGAC
jgi:hypothetical protein